MIDCSSTVGAPEGDVGAQFLKIIELICENYYKAHLRVLGLCTPSLDNSSLSLHRTFQNFLVL